MLNTRKARKTWTYLNKNSCKENKTPISLKTSDFVTRCIYNGKELNDSSLIFISTISKWDFNMKVFPTPSIHSGCVYSFKKHFISNLLHESSVKYPYKLLALQHSQTNLLCQTLSISQSDIKILLLLVIVHPFANVI
jgi:hypothetical protein